MFQTRASRAALASGLALLLGSTAVVYPSVAAAPGAIDLAVIVTPDRPTRLVAYAAEELADHIVITSDNPRSEDPVSIITMIQAGMSGDLSNVQALPDRAAAIMAAVRHADIRDIVLVAGKGHESSQEINGKKFDFSDQEHIRLAAGGKIGRAHV